MHIFENGHLKILQSPGYNYIFSKHDGMFARWGQTREDDPNYSPFGPEILDIEVTTICNGVPGIDGVCAPCKFCYKGNGPSGENMSLETFKKVIDKFPPTLTQIALGADATCQSNPELFDMANYARSKGIIPNITVANITDEVADRLASLCGAVAVSRYANKNVCYDTVKRLTDRGMKQVNIHAMVSDETYDQVLETLQDRLTDSRLSKLNAIVLLSLKKKGRGTKFNSLDQERFTELVKLALDNGIGVGFDSCSAHKFIEAIKDNPNKEQLLQMVEPCESFGMFSAYVNSSGSWFPCSFAEGEKDWEEGVDLTSDSTDFMKDVWFSDKLNQYRRRMIDTNRHCPIYSI